MERTMLTLLFLHQFNDTDKRKLVNGLKDIYTIIFPDDFSEENVLHLARSADVLLGMKVSEKMLDNCPNLKLIQTPSAGVDKLPLSLLKQKDILLCNSHSNSYYVAEYAVSLLLALTKKIALQGTEQVPETLKGKVVGILGYGKIGKQVSEFLGPFGCTQIIFKHHQHPEREQNSERSFTHDLQEILPQADYIIVTLPLTSATRGLIGEREFALMKKSACILNVGRGQVIDQEALYLALKEKRIKAAAIDAWYDDFVKEANTVTYSAKYHFEELDNIILSPYRAALAEVAPHLDDVIKNLRLFATTGKVINVVDLEQGY